MTAEQGSGVRIQVMCAGMVDTPTFTSLEALEAWLAGDGVGAEVQEIQYSAPSAGIGPVGIHVHVPAHAELRDDGETVTIVAVGGRDAWPTLKSTLDLYGGISRGASPSPEPSGG